MYSRRAISSVSLLTFGIIACLGTARAQEVASQETEPATPPSQATAASSSGATGVINGTIRLAYFSDNRALDAKSGYLAGSVWLTAETRPADGLRLYFDGRIQNQDLSRRSKSSLEIREGYAVKTIGDFDIKAGRQITVWGRADKVNPTDSFSTRDLTLLATDDEDNRLGVAAVQATWAHGDYRVIGLWQPEWRSPVLPPASVPAGITLERPEPRHASRQAGIKLDHSGTALDWSVSYAHSLDRTPDLALPRPGVLALVYHPVDVWGADMAASAGPYGLRAEIAYTRTLDHDGRDPLTKNSNLFLVAGADRSFLDGNLTLNVQYLYRSTDRFAAGHVGINPALLGLAQQVDVASNQLEKGMHGASLNLRYLALNNTLTAEISGAVWFHGKDYILRPKLTYAISDTLAVVVGTEVFNGPNASSFGRLKKASTGFFELRRSF